MLELPELTPISREKAMFLNEIFSRFRSEGYDFDHVFNEYKKTSYISEKMYSEAINEFEIFSKDKNVNESKITSFKNIISHRGVEK